MITTTGLNKKYGSKLVVNNLDLNIEAGRVTGLLGPNGAGKSTTMRMMLGLARPTSGEALINGIPYRKHKSPITEVGALLEAKSVHPGRNAYKHLAAIAATHGLPAKRVDEVLELTGLSSVAKKRAGKFSLGMGQRLGIAVALLGNPKVLILDEPINGLDPDGVLWVRNFLRALASEGKTVLLSSHLMSELSLTADHVIIMAKGEKVMDSSMKDLLTLEEAKIRMRSPEIQQLLPLLQERGAEVVWANDYDAELKNIEVNTIGDIAAENNARIYWLQQLENSLEKVYLDITKDSTEYDAKVSLVSEEGK